jgi:aryl-alcohol dehydrogenase-like predicted oxidoreductase
MIRKLGKSGLEVSALGLGCWPIGGQFIHEGIEDGYSNIDDAESIRALQKAIEIGVNYFDTSDAYGVGHSEEIIGKVIKGKRNSVVLSTKFGHFGNESTKTILGTNLTPDYIEKACNASLKRLGTDYIDLYLLHVWSVQVSDIYSVLDTLDNLIAKGKIRTYGWSTDLVGGVKIFAERKYCSAVMNLLNVFFDAPQMLELCEKENLASINRSPLAMGILSGKYNADSFISKNDVRGAGHSWIPYFNDGKPVSELLKKLDAIKQILTSNGRTLTQGALAWIWARSEKTIPIPGFKTVKQVEENAKAMEFGPLTKEQLDEIKKLIDNCDIQKTACT